MIIQSARGFHPNALMKLKQQTPLTYRVSNEDQIKQFKSTQSMLKGYKKESKKWLELNIYMFHQCICTVY